ncbi:MAG: hypothetical protein HY659_05250 [Rhizobiales bacterium]|nr:hypothetical protein [Hyphomicrobiales bacterium]
MIRPVLTEIVLFALPFVLYAAFLVATRTHLLDPESWSVTRLIWLTAAAFLLMIGSFVVFAQFGGVPIGSTYIPAHIEGGKLVPGTVK